MGMKMIQKRKNNAIDLSDGAVNLPSCRCARAHEGEPTKQAGIDHIGFSWTTIRNSFV